VTQDIGAVGLTGSASYSSGTFTVTGSGADIEGTADAFRYIYQTSSSNCEVRAQVVSVQNTDPWAKAGVMIRENTAAGAVNAMVEITSGNGVPPMSATQSFTVTLTQPVRPTLSFASITNNQFGFWINGNIGPDYTIQSSTDLVSWAIIAEESSPVLPYFWLGTNTAASPYCFYRAVLGP
jgi:hypothetical protein